MALPVHVAVIPDGNGRWAQARGLPRPAGHAVGVETVRRIVRVAGKRGIRVISFYGFSSENWRRPPEEVGALMSLFEQFLRSEQEELVELGIRLQVIGELYLLSPGLRQLIQEVEERTSPGTKLTLVIAMAYGGRAELVNAAAQSEGGVGDEQSFSSRLYTKNLPDVDLMIRTGGEMRISNFLLWQSAYAELYFCDTLWPDFMEADFDKALERFASRQRRFGGVIADPSV